MRLPEQRLWDRARPQLAARGLRMRRIENVVDEGMPDVLVRAGGVPHDVVTMVELKEVVSPPKRSTTPLLGDKKGLSVAQRNWHLWWRDSAPARRPAAGGRSAILVGVGSDIVLCVPGRYADVVNGWTLGDWARHSRCDWGWAAMVLGWRTEE